MKVEELQLPSEWNLCPISTAFEFTKKPRGLDLSTNGNEIPFFPMNKIPLRRIYVSEFTPKPLSQLGNSTRQPDDPPSPTPRAKENRACAGELGGDGVGTQS